MKNLLIKCYYDGMTLKEATDFIIRCYGESPNKKQIESAISTIKNCKNIEWK